MCGFIGFSHANLSVHKEALDQSISEISPRGTSVHTLHLEHVSLGYARLPTDAVHSEKDNEINVVCDGTILFNGIITNVEDLCDMFDLGPECRQLDTTCIREGFLRFGATFLERVRGMFAFAIITEQKITLVRDTIGIKPLYYQFGRELIGFSSEIKGLHKADPNEPIHELFPGQILTVELQAGRKNLQTFQYNAYKFNHKSQLDECVREAVVFPTLRYLQQTDKKVGILLSGGLDSSLLCYVLFTNLPAAFRNRICVFTLGYEDSDDVQFARIVQRQLGIDVTYLKPWSDDETLIHIDEVIHKVESADPRVVKVALLQDVLARALEEREIQVLISGEGADELFFGYERFIENLTPEQSEFFFTSFMREIFPQTLLQRYDRQFARRCIEGRVPFLDQELIELSKLFLPHEKVLMRNGVVFNKAPLRKLATSLGLDEKVANREKVKMTKGVTKQENNEDESNGFLEQLFRENKDLSFREYCLERLREIFPNCDRTFPVYRSSEEELMGMVQKTRTWNELRRIAS
ncbi:asparagine synthase-related protein [Agrobacterium vitis]|uniref:asparagine synthase-related protein n=1 Tax=Agrobacterium vitis TaxID=373 RepID=UPI0018D203DE|nr:asparagine synthetase B [Agrobacterium vitis]